MRTWLYTMSLVSAIAIAGTAFAARPKFEDLDQNKDGVLSKAEVSKVKGLDFAKADKNGDGSLDRSEYEAAAG